MKRRDLFKQAAALGFIVAAPALAGEGFAARGGAAGVSGAGQPQSAPAATPLTPPKGGTIPVAYALSPGVVEVDFTGPWGIFGSVMLPGKDMVMPFHQYTVAERKAPLRTDSGLTVVPDYTFESAPQPKIIVIPAQDKAPEEMLEWIRKASAGTDVTMSVCVGAFTLAKTGLLDGKSATTHHSAYKHFADQFPKVHLVRGVRFVDEGNVATAGGLTCGSDLAMHVVERYFGRKLAQDTAYYLEYQSLGWKDPNSNAIYARPSKS
jgi:transcriptional regulator GlxA family with amidase domain